MNLPDPSLFLHLKYGEDILDPLLNSAQIIELISGNDALKEICAILANIKDSTDLNPEISEDSAKIKEFEKYRKRIKASQEVLKTFDSCREWLKKTPHTKWPKDIDGEGNEPDEELIRQLYEWNGEGERANRLIENIEILADYLEQVMEFLKA